MWQSRTHLEVTQLRKRLSTSWGSAILQPWSALLKIVREEVTYKGLHAGMRAYVGVKVSLLAEALATVG